MPRTTLVTLPTGAPLPENGTLAQRRRGRPWANPQRGRDRRQPLASARVALRQGGLQFGEAETAGAQQDQ